MAVSVIYANPNPRSFTHAIAETVVAALQQLGFMVNVHDLYAEGFDAILPQAELTREAPLEGALRQHCAEAAMAEGFVVVHPNWWGMPPAILTGWVDRVLRAGVAYRFQEGDNGEGVPIGLLQAQHALIFNTANTPPERECTVFGDPLDTIWKQCIFGLCGVEDVRRRTFAVMVTSTPEQRAAWLDEVTQQVADTFRFRFHEVPLLCDEELELHLCACRPGNPTRDIVPAYDFDMRVDGQLVGRIDLRIGNTPALLMCGGHIGYTVFPNFRGHHYAERASRLLLPLAAAHDMHTLWITCNPDNAPSRRTCERLGATLVDIVPLPEDDTQYQRGERTKCRYRIELG